MNFLATIYTAALLATLPVVVAAVASLCLRRANAEARSLVWRSAVAALFVVFVGRQQPLHWIALVVPSALAAPLVELGRASMTVSSAPSAGTIGGETMGGLPVALIVVRAVMVIYLAGVIAVLLPTVVFSLRARRRVAQSAQATDASWMTVLKSIRAQLGIARPVRLFVDKQATVPMTWGVFHPVIVLPTAALEWSASDRSIVLLHELVHVRTGDWAFKVAARVVCALYWFHPGAWWIARNLRDDCELSCDDRVIAAGVRRSDYAELLVAAAERLRGAAPVEALALSERGGLRARLAAVLDASHRARPLRREWALVACTLTVGLVCPASAVQLAPTRDVLTTLMRDTRWESRAYAVIGLAQRADSIAEARSAAEADPNPRVRAWARYALGETITRPDSTTVVRDR
jgi:beta-lactamase regulating signal transducer with metallopeptidase domain